jgi:cytochrome c biogenesis protein CcmG/thiol:disulfide interchange protein DsbE
MRPRLGAGIALAAVVAVVAIELATGGSGPAAGRPAPPLPRAVLTGPRVTLAELRGRPAAINFWASWCEPCRHEAPQLERLWRSLHGRARLVGVDYSDGAAAGRSFVREYGLTYPNLRDPEGRAGAGYGIVGLPDTAILDSNGHLVELLRGPQTAASVRRALLAADRPAR